MNLCIVSFQAVLLAILVQVEAEKRSYVSDGNWLSSIEKQGPGNYIPYLTKAKAPHQVVVEKQEAPKRKRRIIKKYKKNNKGKRDQREHLPHEQRLDASVEQEKASVEQEKAKSTKRIMRKNHKKREKVRTNRRKFIKMLPIESNSTESDEVKRRQPVDIIVHIKMND